MLEVKVSGFPFLVSAEATGDPYPAHAPGRRTAVQGYERVRTIAPLEQTEAIMDIMHDVFQETLVAVYLHGSAVAGGLRPRSDIDFLVIIDRPMSGAQRNSLLSALLRISSSHPACPGGPRCIEVMAFLKSRLVTLQSPPQAEFIYGEWLRPAFETGEIPLPVSNPELFPILAQARQEARALYGPDAAELLPEISLEQVRHVMRDLLPALLAGLRGDERNVLLTLARMWRTATTGEFVAKDAAAIWAVSQIPDQEAETLAHACEVYLGRIEDEWETRQAAAGRTAEYLCRRVSALL